MLEAVGRFCAVPLAVTDSGIVDYGIVPAERINLLGDAPRLGNIRQIADNDVFRPRQRAARVGGARCIACVQRDLVAMQKEDVTPAELQQAKALVLRQLSLRAASEDDLAGSLLGFAEMGLPLDELNRAANRYASLSAAEVRAAFAKWIRPEMFVQVVRGPAPQ